MPDMLVKLYELPSHEKLLEDLRAGGVVVRRASAHEKRHVLRFAKEEFHPGWADECDVAFTRNPISCFIAVENESVIGFACYDVTRKSYFGPTAVLDTAQGRGIGKALLLAALWALWHEGYAYAIIGGAGPTGFYEKHCNAVAIPGSSPGIYGNKIRSELDPPIE
ncbi:MAG: GNAT family N-acetyltransferase [Phycisphaeraceae bacterium]